MNDSVRRPPARPRAPTDELLDLRRALAAGRPTKRLELAALFGSTRFKPTIDLVALAWPRERTLTLLRRSGSAFAWNLDDGETTPAWTLPVKRAESADFSRDARHALIVDGERAALWRCTPPKRRGEGIQRRDRLGVAGVSPDGERAVVCGDGNEREFEVFVVDTRRSLWKGIRRASPPIAISRDGRRAAWAASSSRGTVTVWDLYADIELVKLPRPPEFTSEAAVALAFSEDGAHLAAAWEPGAITLCSLAGPTIRWTVRLDALPSTDRARPRLGVLGFTAFDAAVVYASAAGAGIHTRSVATGEALASGPLDAFERAVFSPSGDRLLVVDTATAKVTDFDVGHNGAVTVVAFARDGASVMTAGRDGLIRVWDRASGETRATFEAHDGGVTAAAIARDGRTIVSLGGDRKVKVWELATLTELRSDLLPTIPSEFKNARPIGPWDGLEDLVLSPDGERALLLGDGLGCWDLTSGLPRWTGVKMKRTTADRVSAARTVASSRACYDPEGRFVYGVSGHGALRVFDARDGDLLSTTDGARRFVDWTAFLSDAREALSIETDTRGRLHRWEIATGVVRWSSPVGRVFRTPIALSPDDRLAAVVEEASVVLFDLATDAELDAVNLDAMADRPTALAFSSDGRGLLVGTKRGMVLDFTVAV